MTLVVANSKDGALFVLADTAVSDDALRTDPFRAGVAKIHILDADRCVTFAGHIGTGVDAIQSLDLARDDDSLTSSLSNTANSARESVEFLLVSKRSSQPVTTISARGISRSSEGWVGDEAAFDVYRNAIDTPLVPDGIHLSLNRCPDDSSAAANDLYGRMFEAMQAVVRSEVASVGGIVVPAFVESASFRFGQYFRSERGGFRPEETLVSDEYRTINVHNPAFGGCAVNFCALGRNGFAIHLNGAPVGITYRNGALVGEMHWMDEIDFQDHLRAGGANGLCMTIAHRSVDFWNKAVGATQRSDHARALGLFTRGIETDSRTWGGENNASDPSYDSLLDFTETSKRPLQLDAARADQLMRAFAQRAEVYRSLGDSANAARDHANVGYICAVAASQR